ncbi:hypothetical protein [Salinarchaeum laminariae]|uniref:hypothetical protein n=1 Tax=Salinarchaeum laminariae TaxID=869888 RepID=UPI0020BDF2AC|nr:hypothetical protein [Salinarchaeum laminariae]
MTGSGMDQPRPPYLECDGCDYTEPIDEGQQAVNPLLLVCEGCGGELEVVR